MKGAGHQKDQATIKSSEFSHPQPCVSREGRRARGGVKNWSPLCEEASLEPPHEGAGLPHLDSDAPAPDGRACTRDPPGPAVGVPPPGRSPSHLQ